jgi:hypothetical protein
VKIAAALACGALLGVVIAFVVVWWYLKDAFRSF